MAEEENEEEEENGGINLPKLSSSTTPLDSSLLTLSDVPPAKDRNK